MTLYIRMTLIVQVHDNQSRLVSVSVGTMQWEIGETLHVSWYQVQWVLWWVIGETLHVSYLVPGTVGTSGKSVRRATSPGTSKIDCG